MSGRRISQMAEPPTRGVQRAADEILRVLESSECASIARLAAESGISEKQAHRAIKYLQSARIPVTWMAGNNCWLAKYKKDPDWDQVTIRQADAMGFLAPFERRRLRASFNVEFPRLNNPHQPDPSPPTLADAVAAGLLRPARAEFIGSFCNAESRAIRRRVLR